VFRVAVAWPKALVLVDFAWRAFEESIHRSMGILPMSCRAIPRFCEDEFWPCQAQGLSTASIVKWWVKVADTVWSSAFRRLRTA
jgi:hypothetical protein